MDQSTVHPRPQLLTTTNGSRKEQRLDSTAGGIRPPISAFRNRFLPVLQHWTDR